MVVTATINEYNTVSETLSADVANLNVGRLDASEMTPGPTNSIPVDSYSYEKWAKVNFAGIDNQVDNIQVWMDDVLHAEATLLSNVRTSSYPGNAVFSTPLLTVSTFTQTIPVADPGAANLGIAGSLTGVLSSDGMSDYFVMQYHASASHPGGSIAQITLTFQYDEQ